MTGREAREALARWRAHVEAVRSSTAAGAGETPGEREARVARLRADYGAFCSYYFPHYMSRPGGGLMANAPFHDEAARLVMSRPNLRAVFMWPRGHAKTTHLGLFLPLWLLFQERPEVSVVVIVGKSEAAARAHLGNVQAELAANARLLADFGPQRGEGEWTDGFFSTTGGAAFFARGRGQSPRGLRYKARRPDYILIDDLDDDELCLNPARVRRLYVWVRSALFGAMDVGRGRFVMVGNLISRNSVLRLVAETAGVEVSTVRAVGDDGEPAWPAKWTRAEADDMRRFMGYRAWEREMMHRPAADGGIFRPEWIRWRDPLPLADYADLVCYTDPSFGSSSSSDYKAARLWGRTRGGEFHLLDCFVRQDTVASLVAWLYDLGERTRGAAVRFFIEAGFMQGMLLDEFRREGEARGWQLPISADRRKKPDKMLRIEAVSPLWERGLVFYSTRGRGSPDFEAGIEQTLAAERGSRAHDDAPDADEGALWMLRRGERSEAWPVITSGPRLAAGW